MSNIIITADSTCDLPSGLADQYNINIIPLYIDLSSGSFRDGIDISPRDIFAYVDKTGSLPKTSGVSVQDYINNFSRYANAGQAVIHISLGSGFSSCYQNACLAAGQFENVWILDSENLSSGSGLLAIEAAVRAQSNKAPGRIVDELKDLVPRIDTSFVIDTLDYLRMGGRCSSVAALGANLLNIKPSIDLKNGSMHVSKKYKGRIGKCIVKYVGDKLKNCSNIRRERIFITHTECSPEIVENVKQVINKSCHFDEIIESIASCTVSCHCGPQTLGILFIREN